ncbi:MAG TPA: hypothetical protein P5320_02035 [Bacteroidales bacterium]|nr:hypothetical protein [Bacteroidales bacterium]HOK73774.1 hypothetical protein [Bacteroidales bacterium]HOM39383.1 hypothetical protein [Bacteroidales bacterium]HPP91492.1 hypothetical protein [Bacteroidales bacterium]HRR15475.1 hypothetical protein [Bacteroidales bacterium]
MKTKLFLLSLAAMLVLGTSAEGQIGRALKEKASQAIGNIGKKAAGKAEREADSLAQQKAEEQIDRQAEAAVEKREQKGINLGGIWGGKVTLKYENEYSFRNYMYMQSEIYSDKDIIKVDYYIYYNNDNLNGCVETSTYVDTQDNSTPMKTSIVYDAANKCMLMLTDMGTTKIGMISEVPDEDKPGAGQEATSKPTITKTGNTRTIAGYKCDEYIYREPDEKGYGKLWVTRDFKMNTNQKAMSKSGLPAYYSELPEGGVVLAMEAYDENNKMTMKSETKEIKKNISYAVNVSGYPLRQININQMESQQPGKK